MRIGSVIHVTLALLAAGSISMAAEPVAMQTEGALDQQLRNYRVELSADGFLPGRLNVLDPQTGSVIPASDMTITFLRNGEVASETRPGVDGVFQVANLQPGVYSVVGSGPAGYIAYGLEVMGYGTALEPEIPPGIVDPSQVALYQEVRDGLMIDSLAIPASDLPAVAGLLRANLPANLFSSNDAGPTVDTAPGAPLPADNSPQSLAASSDLRRHQVLIRADGSIAGRMRRIHPRTGQPTRIRRLNVFLVQNNTVVGRAQVDEQGVFSIPNVRPGMYSFVSAGIEGFATFAIQAVSNTLASSDIPNELFVPVSLAQVDPAQEFQELKDIFASTIQPEDLPAALERLDNLLQQLGLGGLGDFGFDPQTGAPTGGGTGGSSSGGSGGGGGGEGGGIGAALIGGALGAAIGAAIADDNEDSPTIISPFSPGPSTGSTPPLIGF